MWDYLVDRKIYKDGVWTVHYKRWPKGECYCSAKKLTVQIKKQGNITIEDIINKELDNDGDRTRNQA